VQIPAPGEVIGMLQEIRLALAFFLPPLERC
jgi:hypothetical protein